MKKGLEQRKLNMASLVSWQLSNSLNAQIIKKSVLQAWNNRGGYPSSVIFHSDRGYQYISEKLEICLTT